MKKIFFFLSAIILFASANCYADKVSDFVKLLNEECPMPLDDNTYIIGVDNAPTEVIIKIQTDDDDVITAMNQYPQMTQGLVKDMFRELANDSDFRTVATIVADANKSFTFRFIGRKTKNIANVPLSPKMIREALK